MKRLFSILCSAMILSAMASPLDLASAADAEPQQEPEPAGWSPLGR